MLAAKVQADEKVINVHHQAVEDVKKAEKVVHKNYANCYALPGDVRSLCISKIALKHINPFWHTNNYYLTTFRFTAEKLGFQHILQEHNIKCPSLEISPIFDPKKQAYSAQCTGQPVIYLKFYQEEQEWKIFRD